MHDWMKYLMCAQESQIVLPGVLLLWSVLKYDRVTIYLPPSFFCVVGKQKLITFIGSCSYGLPWWRSGWESACQCRAHGFKPWSGKIPHAAEQLGPWATIAEPMRLEPVLRNRRGRDSERPVHRDEEWPPLSATRESPRTEMKTQHSQN